MQHDCKEIGGSQRLGEWYIKNKHTHKTNKQTCNVFNCNMDSIWQPSYLKLKGSSYVFMYILIYWMVLLITITHHCSYWQSPTWTVVNPCRCFNNYLVKNGLPHSWIVIPIQAPMSTGPWLVCCSVMILHIITDQPSFFHGKKIPYTIFTKQPFWCA